MAQTGKRMDDGCCPLCGQAKPNLRPLRFGSLVIEDGKITDGRVTVRLSAVTFAILAALARRSPRPLSIDSIMQVVWGDSDNPPLERNIDVHIWRLRKFLGREAIQSQFGGLRTFHPDKVVLNPQAVFKPRRRSRLRWTFRGDATKDKESTHGKARTKEEAGAPSTERATA